jgi:large subunit ribosomal protein L29
MKANNFRDMTDVELNQKLADLKGELFNLRFQLATGQLENPLRIRNVRREIARVKTIIREREISKLINRMSRHMGKKGGQFCGKRSKKNQSRSCSK